MTKQVSVFYEIQRAGVLLDQAVAKSGLSESYFSSKYLGTANIRARVDSERITVRKLRDLIRKLEEYLG